MSEGLMDITVDITSVLNSLHHLLERDLKKDTQTTEVITG